MDPRSAGSTELPPDFYLFLTEDRAALPPRACCVRGILRTNGPARLTVVDLDPPLPRDWSGTERDLERAVLAPRRFDHPVEDVHASEVPVVLCVPRNGAIDLGAPGLMPRELRPLEWGRIRLSATR